MTTLQILLHIAIVLTVPPLMRGIIIRTKAWFAGRQGAPIWQPYYDLIKLLQKGFVISTTTTTMFTAGTVLTLAATLAASLIVPFGAQDAPLAFAGDMILFAYLLGLVRLFMTLASLDTGSAFEGMGVAREVTFACLAEPAMFFGLLVTSQLSHQFSLTGMFNEGVLEQWEGGASSLLLVMVSWFIVMLAENSRVPFDDPNTHLELTMVHEVIVLDHSGPLLGMMLYAAGIKLFLFAALIVRVIVPLTGNVPLDWGLFLVGIALVAVLIGVVESIMARLRMNEIPKLLATACVLSGLGFLLLVA